MVSRRTKLVALLAAPLVLVVSMLAVNAADALSSPAPTAASDSIPATPTITISMFAFHTPAKVTHGVAIKVVNKDSVEHTVTSVKSGLFNVVVPAHASRTFHAPAKAGTYRFYCAIHPSMHGVLHVS